MTKAKAFLTLLIVSILLLSACKNKVQTKQIKQGLELSAHPGGIIYLDTTPIIHIATTLFNPSDDTARFVTMTCSYEDMFLTDTTDFKVHSRYDCFSNYPTVFEIPPHSKLDQYIMVRPTSKDIKAWDKKIRVGMYYLVPKNEDGSEGIIKQHDNRQKATILWSNQLDLSRLYRRVYQ
jgi:hypothetical protein